MATSADVARILGVAEPQLRAWTTTFAEYLSTDAVARGDREAVYNEADLRALAFVAYEIEAGDEHDEISGKLEAGRHFEEPFVELARLHTPLFRDVPDEIDETWRHGTLIGGMAARDLLQVARSYKAAADELAGRALTSHEPHELDYPALFLYRHAIELYLKAMLKERPRTHDLGKLIDLLEKQYGGKLGGWVGDRLRDFHEIDSKSDMFRYNDLPSDDERWIDFHQLRFVIDRIIQAFERELRRR